jgi:hypothetical protein
MPDRQEETARSPTKPPPREPIPRESMAQRNGEGRHRADRQHPTERTHQIPDSDNAHELLGLGPDGVRLRLAMKAAFTSTPESSFVH